MKNRAQIETTLFAYLQDNQDRGKTVLLSGPWGCGKTYLWREMVSKYFEMEKPLTISLFGIDSMSSLKGIVMNECMIRKLSDVKDKKWDAAKKGLGKLVEFGVRKGMDKLLSIDALSSHIDPLQLIDDGLLICFDDIERASRQLPLEEVLGLANTLAETKRARVVLIMNETELAERPDDAEIMKRFKERVFAARITVDTDTRAVYDSIIDKLKEQTEIYQLLLRQRTSILNLFEKSGNCNLRTLGRLIESIAYLARTTGAKVIQDEHVCFLAIILMESDSGKLREKMFYQFNEISILLHLGNKVDPKTQEKFDFLAHYFGDPGSSQFVYSDSLFNYVKNGYLDLKEITDEFAPNQLEQTPVQQILMEATNRHFFYYSDEECTSFLSRSCRLILSAEPMTTAQIIILLNSMTFSAARSGLPLPVDIHSKVMSRLMDNARHCDDSFDSSERMQYSLSRDLWGSIIEDYDRKLHLAQNKSLSKKLADIIDRRDKDEFIRELRRRPNSLMIVLQPDLLDRLMATLDKDREFHKMAIVVLREELETYDTTIYSSLVADRNRFAVALRKLVSTNRLDKSDLYRLGPDIDKCATW